MARYIDAEIALKTIDSYAKTVTADGKVVVDAIRDIVSVITPTADVAPKSEVAREIFEEILNIIRAYEFDALTAKNNYGVFQVRNLGTDILKLKKKYTEGQT